MSGQTTKSENNPVATSEGFISFPSVFKEAPPDLRHVVQVIHRPAVRKGEVGLEFSTDAAVVNFGGVVAEQVDMAAVAVDCDLMKRVALESPEELREILAHMQRGTPEGIGRAIELSEKIGLTEGAAIKAGGGFIWLIVIGAAILLSGGCGGALKEKSSSASTTPKPPGPQ